MKRKDPSIELEMRLGSVCKDDQRFVTGVQSVVFETLDSDLTRSPSLKADKTWCEVVDYYYPVKDAVFRTRVETNVSNLTFEKSHVYKKGLLSKTLIREEEGGDACKIACSSEKTETPPTVCFLSYVRIKQRKTFRDIRENCVVWSYELCKTWSAPSKEAAEYKKKYEEPIYEVEVELVDEDGSYMETNTDNQIAESIYLKSKLLLGEEENATLFLVKEKEKNKRKWKE
jgi:hypothetical protein